MWNYHGIFPRLLQMIIIRSIVWLAHWIPLSVIDWLSEWLIKIFFLFSKASLYKPRKAVERKIMQGDMSGAVRILCSGDAVGPPTAEVHEVIKTKPALDKPDAHYPPATVADNFNAMAISAEEVQHAVTSFPNGSAGGLDELRPQHLKDMVSHATGEAASKLLEYLAKLLIIMLHGKVAGDVCSLLCGASLTALRKKDHGIRPIVVGDVLRRLAGKIVSRRVMESMRPSQLGYVLEEAPKQQFTALGQWWWVTSIWLWKGEEKWG